MPNTQAQEKTIGQIRSQYVVHTKTKQSIWVSFGKEDNRIGIEIDSTGKIISAMVVPQPSHKPNSPDR